MGSHSIIVSVPWGFCKLVDSLGVCQYPLANLNEVGALSILYLALLFAGCRCVCAYGLMRFLEWQTIFSCDLGGSVLLGGACGGDLLH